ncbi:MAG: multicopper oxidase domain-containing protein [Chloroflexota bacterium]
MNKVKIVVSMLGFTAAILFSFGPASAALSGQVRTCGSAPQNRTIKLTAEEKVVDIGDGVTTEAWTFNGTSPGPTIEACEGDSVKIVVENKGKLAHGFDTHALRINPAHFGPVDPGKTMVIEKKVTAPGVFMYHCANGPVTDQHIKMGMYGVMIVYPRNQKLRPAREIVVSENGVYGEPNQDGKISPSSERMNDNRAAIVLYNGTMKHNPVEVRAGDLVRVYFVNAGPYTSAFHVIGAILDKAYESGNPGDAVSDVQTYGVPAGSGSMFEFTVPEKGTYLLVDHDKLSQLPNGLVIPIMAREQVAGKPGKITNAAH